jgi:hypothetical protein
MHAAYWPVVVVPSSGRFSGGAGSGLLVGMCDVQQRTPDQRENES